MAIQTAQSEEKAQGFID